MSTPDETLSTGELPSLVSASISTQIPSLAPGPTPKPPPLHITPKPPPMPAGTSTTPDYAKLHASLGASGLVKSAIMTIPKLTGNEDYINWSDQAIAVLKYCGIDKILTGEWAEPAVVQADKDSERNAQEWKSLDAWISLHLNLSDAVRSQVRHLATSHEKWAELKKLFKPTSATSITLHLTSIVNVRFDESTKFEDFVASKCEHNRLLGELGGKSLPDSYIAILIRSGLPEHLKQTIAHIPDDTITTDQIVNIIRSRQQESMINNMQSSPSDTALLGHYNKTKQKKRDFQPCKTPGCPKPSTHPTQNCWAPGGPKHDPNRQRKSNRRNKERAHKVDDDDDDDDDGSTTSMNIRIDRSFIAKSDSGLLYVSPPEPSTSLSASQAYLAKGSAPIIIDSGTTSHIHNERSDFNSLDKDDVNNITGFGDGAISSSGRGTATLWTKSPGRKGSVNRITLNKAMFVPSSNVSLLSVSRFDKAGCRVEFVNGRCTISDMKTNETILVGTMRKNLYYLDNVIPDAAMEVPTKVYHTTNSEITLDLMHRRLGHLNMRAVKQLFKKNMVRGVTLSEKHLRATPSICDCCVRGKMQRSPLPKSSSRKTEILELVHSDLWGPAPVMSLGGKFYFISFSDDSARHSWTYYLRKKSEAFEAFKVWHKEVERQTGRKLRIFRSDNGGEYITIEWELYMKEHGIIHQKSTPRTPEQNGVSERLNLTIMDRVCTILIESQLPLSLWAEAVEYAVYTKNRSPTAVLKGKTPYEAFWGEKPDISNLRVFGSQCYVHNDSPTRRKLDVRAFPAIFIGYSTPSKAWRYYIPSKRKSGTSRNIIFDERVRSSSLHHNIEGELTATKTSSHKDLLVPDSASKPNFDDDDIVPPNIPTPPTLSQIVEPPSTVRNPAPSTSSSPPNIDTQLTPPIPTPLPQPPLKRRVRGPAKVYEKSRSSQRLEDRKRPPPEVTETTDDSDEFKSLGKNSDDEDDKAQVHDELEPEHSELTGTPAYLATGEDPDSYEEAIDSVDRDEWQAAMQAEMDSIVSVGTFELVPPPRDRKPIGCKWVYRIKRDSSGEISCYKARLVAQGFAQKPGIDFTETFAPVAKTDSIRLLLAFAAANNFEIHQVDVKSAFLNGELEETIYMRQPKGFTAKGKEDWVWQLNQTLYGLRQSGRVWYQKLRDALLELGFTPSAADPCVFIRLYDGNLSIIFTHVDDLGLICNSVSIVAQLKGELAKYFPISDLGEVHHLLGIKITRDRDKHTIALSQERYILDLLRKFGFESANPVRTPLDTSTRLSKDMSPTGAASDNDQQEYRDFPYQSIVGSLMHAAVMTRPDIAHAVQQVVQFMSDPQPAHCVAVKRILRYLRGTANHQLTFGPDRDSKVIAYCDADFAKINFRIRIHVQQRLL